MEKGEIAGHKQFLLFHNVFKRLVLQTRKNKGLFGKGLKQNLLFFNNDFTLVCLNNA